jgi:hypothetical protein
MTNIVGRVLPLPASMAEVAEALQVPTEIGSQLSAANATCRILQEWVNLDLLVELRRAKIHEDGAQCFHVAFVGIESHTARPNRILVLVCNF